MAISVFGHTSLAADCISYRLLCAQANRLGHLVCGNCNITLMYAHGAQSVKCAVCQYVTAVSSSNMFRHGQPGSEVAPAPPSTLTQTVVIENPPSLDEHGNQVNPGPFPSPLLFCQCAWPLTERLAFYPAICMCMCVCTCTCGVCACLHACI